ncbi:hypothetical protein CFE70_005276 [Pyrenophora teres f. teres 0-1]|uniref:Uncharacterized protein n=2 Tax=Pyrenophora teres f. teres TaxID=97479 RepID=E3RQQ7_PYRTT|nr:hypothetical protein PTT_11074 [Pyrenophora teres f. teres 0-1]KAE8827603.1 hypothetical protein HRS9122_09584 [Pyrenophora teres f. teres]KAE8839207.1 hypothetical protein HRS9139_03590 [Pyrenophora teres f. teres]KAE8845171.1 hypothetical protein PTNB85_03436 [Pyrenophora teres f. teres]KAE8865682.1 hypothetical protein PTNB29_02829 [Pyrenophora teres f. teres]
MPAIHAKATAIIMVLLFAVVTIILTPTFFTTPEFLLLLVTAVAGIAIIHSSYLAAAVSISAPPTNAELVRITVARLQAKLEDKEFEYFQISEKYVKARQRIAVLTGRIRYLEDIAEEQGVEGMNEHGIARPVEEEEEVEE